jgi:hypothetical protein
MKRVEPQEVAALPLHTAIRNDGKAVVCGVGSVKKADEGWLEAGGPFYSYGKAHWS